MRIQNINSFNYTQNVNKPAFKSWHREVYHTIQNVDTAKGTYEFIQSLKYRNDTYLYRDNSFWKNLMKFLVNKYDNVKNVNVFDYACSNGSEAYTFVMQMLSNFQGNVSDKFLPIIAKDCDPLAIEKANSGMLLISDEERVLIDNYTGNKFDKFFGARCKYNEQKTPVYYVQRILTDLVKFSQGDIFDDLDKLPKFNNVVFARNFWPYLSDAKRNDLAEMLSANIGENSTLIIGNYDLMCGEYNNKLVSEILYDNGFRKVFNHELLDCVYEK